MTRRLKSDRRLMILDAARKTIAARGFLGTRSQDVAEAARVSEGLLFRYFPSMRALQEAVVAKGMEGKPEPWPRGLSELRPRAALRAAASAFLSVFVRDPALLRLTLFGALFGDSDSVEPYRREVRRTSRQIASLVRRWKEAGWVRSTLDPRSVACLFVSTLVYGVMTQDVLGLTQRESSLDAGIHALVELLRGSDETVALGAGPVRQPVTLKSWRDLPGRRR